MSEWIVLLRNRRYAMLWAGRTVSWFGNAIAPLALGFAVLQLTGSVADLGLVVSARSLPNLATVAFGGVLADRMSRATLLLVSAIVAGASQLVAGLSLYMHFASLVLLVALAITNGISAALAGPTSGALVPDLVPDEQLQDASVLGRVGMNVALLGGTGCAGIIVAWFGVGAGLLVDSATFFIAAACFAAILRHLPSKPTSPQETMFRSLVQGLTYVRNERWIASIAAALFIYQLTFAGGIQVLGIATARANLSPVAWGLAGAAQTGGLLIGAIIVGSSKRHLRISTGMLTATSVALPIAVLAVIEWRSYSGNSALAILCVSMALAGLLFEYLSIASDLAVQRRVPNDLLGRVFALTALGSLSGMPLGEVSAGVLGSAIGLVPALIAYGAFGASALAWFARGPGVRGLTTATPTDEDFMRRSMVGNCESVQRS